MGAAHMPGMTDQIKRTPAGVPTGGQFASHDRADGTVQLDDNDAGGKGMSPAAFAEMLHGKGFELGDARGIAAAAVVVDTARELLAAVSEHQQKKRYAEAAVATMALTALSGVQAKLWGEGTTVEGRIAAIVGARAEAEKSFRDLRYAPSIDTFATNLDAQLSELEEMLRAE